MNKLLTFFIFIQLPLFINAQELEVYKTDSVTAVRSFIYITEGSWIKSGAVILSRIKYFNTGQELFGFSIATTSRDSKSREIPEGVTILLKHLDNTITELYTESGDFSEKEKSIVVAAGSRYVAFATTISTYSYSYSCEISREDLRKIAQWGIKIMRIDTPGPGWQDFNLTGGNSQVSQQLKTLGKMAKRIDGINMNYVKPDSYSGF